MRPSFSISVPDAVRVSEVSFSRSRISSSMVRLPTMARRWPANTLWTRASFGSATRHRKRKTMTRRRAARTAAVTTMPMVMEAGNPLAAALQGGDDDRPRWEVLDHDDPLAGGDGVVVVGGVGVERLRP